ncbi:MAG: hypothetical protein Q8O61_09870 [Nocardioides sp.]|nr:hypothetical protein [Nocardioides sp.]
MGGAASSGSSSGVGEPAGQAGEGRAQVGRPHPREIGVEARQRRGQPDPGPRSHDGVRRAVGAALEPGDDPFLVSVRGQDAAEVTTYWERLSAGATVVVPLGPAAWAPLYGMLTDRFGVTWVLDVVAEQPA